MNHQQEPNALIHETSPYLLQHAYNPVKWHPWGKEAFEKAQKENKPLIISIGYSSCHWCHVMEKESFEDEEIAKIMNNYFIPVKVDREELPDIDNLYMDAVQLLTGRGGWPLNVFALPDGRPFYGGTYFPKNQWKQILMQLHEIYLKQPEKVEETAAQLTMGIRKMDLIVLEQPSEAWKKKDFVEAINKLQPMFDTTYGGLNRAPKFPVPSFYHMLFNLSILDNNQWLFDFVITTLNRMALGGIFDHVGGGFARYSTDTRWKVPHFEKMLYDNAQLLQLYALAYRKTHAKLYRQTVEKTARFLLSEFSAKNGGFYSALDADSEGEEGKYYTWTKEELQKLIPQDDQQLFFQLYNIRHEEIWEHKYILHKEIDNETFARQNNIPLTILERKENEWMKRLYEARNKRKKPLLDDKILTSWNALAISGLISAYLATGNKIYLERAKKTMQFIWQNLMKDTTLYHTWQRNQVKIPGYCDDYAFTCKALLDLYSATFDESYLNKAEKLVQITFERFYDDSTGLFLYRDKTLPSLVAVKREIYDNVIPSSNSVMAEVLHHLYLLTDNKKYERHYTKMLKNIYSAAIKEPYQFANWWQLFFQEIYPSYELVFAGPQAIEQMLKFCQKYYPNVFIAGTEKESDIPLLKNRYVKGKTFIYLCKDKTCKLPVEDVEKIYRNIAY